MDVDIESEIVKEEELQDDVELSKEQRTEVARQTLQCIKDYFKLEHLRLMASYAHMIYTHTIYMYVLISPLSCCADADSLEEVNLRVRYGLEKVYCVSTRRKLRKDYDFQSLQRDILEAVRKQRG